MNQVTKNLGCEWAKDDIRVNSVAPWLVRTSMAEYLINEPEFLKKIESEEISNKTNWLDGSFFFFCFYSS